MKAYLVNFSVTTRVVVDTDEDPNCDSDLYNRIVGEAYIRMGDLGFENFLNGENSEITEDTEMPADEDDIKTLIHIG